MKKLNLRVLGSRTMVRTQSGTEWHSGQEHHRASSWHATLGPCRAALLCQPWIVDGDQLSKVMGNITQQSSSSMKPEVQADPSACEDPKSVPSTSVRVCSAESSKHRWRLRGPDAGASAIWFAPSRSPVSRTCRRQYTHRLARNRRKRR